MRWLRARGEQAAPDRIVGVTFDISEHKEAEEEIWRSANHDALTGLPNRNLFQHRLESGASPRREKTGTSVSLLLIDLDDFDDINDTLRSRCRRCPAAGDGSPPVPPWFAGAIRWHAAAMSLPCSLWKPLKLEMPTGSAH